MALVNCPECNHVMSEFAKKCPNCGYKIKRKKIKNDKYKNIQKVLLVIAIIVIIIGACFGINTLFKYRVPDVCGMNIEDAQIALANLDKDIIINEKYTYDFDKGIVVYQSISANSFDFSKEDLVLDVSKGRKYIVPDVVEKNYTECKDLLEGINCDLKYLYTEDKEKGIIIAMSLEAGTEITEEDSLVLMISRGIYTYIPDLCGKNISEVEQILNDLNVTYQLSEDYSGYEKGIVYDFGPIRIGDLSEKVYISVSKGKGKDVPNIVGKDVNRANKLLSEISITPNWIYTYDDMSLYNCSAILEPEVTKQEYSGMISNDITSMDVTANKQSIVITEIKFNMDSVGGVDTYISFKNLSDKQIAYVTFTVVYYDRMGYRASCEIRGKSSVNLNYTGPLNANSTKNNIYWRAAIYNSTVSAIKPEIAVVEFTDGTKQKLMLGENYWYDYNYYGGNLRN